VPFRACAWFVARLLPLTCLYFACRFVLVSAWWFAFCRLPACALRIGWFRAASRLYPLRGWFSALACL
jgi:hypothetical protein